MARGPPPIVAAAREGNVARLKSLLASGADPYPADRNGNTALSAAVGGAANVDRFTVGHGQTEAVRILTSAAPDLRLRHDSAAFRVARFVGCSEVLRLLR